VHCATFDQPELAPSKIRHTFGIAHAKISE
jgi:hypothetical protein